MAFVDSENIETLVDKLKKETSQIESFTQNDTIQIDSNDDRLNYLFVKKEDIEKKVFAPTEYLDIDKIDYGVITDKKDSGDNHTAGCGEFDKTMPASFFGVKTIEEGTDYYLRKNPELPEGVAEIMARYTFGTKQEEKKKNTKSKKKNKKEDKLEVKHGKFVVDFS